MEQYKKEFIDFMLESKVLKFGDFTLKSGRKSPFFMNAGGYVTGNITQRPSLINMVKTLMYYSDLHIREFHWLLRLQSH